MIKLLEIKELCKGGNYIANSRENNMVTVFQYVEHGYPDNDDRPLSISSKMRLKEI